MDVRKFRMPKLGYAFVQLPLSEGYEASALHVALHVHLRGKGYIPSGGRTGAGLSSALAAMGDMGPKGPP